MAAELGLTIHSKLAGYQLPGASSAYFFKVFKGEPNALTASGGRAMARWKVLRSQVPPEGPRVITGARMTAIVYQLNAYWPLSASAEAQEDHEDDIAAVLIDLPNEFIGLTPSDYTIGGYPVAALTVEDTSFIEREPFADSPVDMRVARWELHARVLEAS